MMIDFPRTKTHNCTKKNERKKIKTQVSLQRAQAQQELLICTFTDLSKTRINCTNSCLLVDVPFSIIIIKPLYVSTKYDRLHESCLSNSCGLRRSLPLDYISLSPFESSVTKFSLVFLFLFQRLFGTVTILYYFLFWPSMYLTKPSQWFSFIFKVLPLDYP